ncbi:hypothetical protein MHYP_G00131480 [Metynnis hypsauchen]
MASCLVPDFPAVKVALEHLGDLDKQLREEGMSFSQEASHHLREIADAIKELEASRKAAHEELEVETIEMSKLRHQVVSQRHEIMNEILAGVAAARDVNAAQLNQLQSEMKSAVEEIEFMERRRKLLEEENAILLPERELIKGSHADLVDQLNEQLSEKADMQIALNELMNDIQTTKEKITQVEMAKKHLSDSMTQERKKFAESKEMLQKEINETMNCIQEQEKTNTKMCKVLDSVTAELMDKEEKVKEKLQHISQLERTIARLSASQQIHQQQLEDNIKKSEELDRQKESYEEELRETRDSFEQRIQNLQEKTAEVENQLEEGWKVNRVYLQSIAELSASFSAQRKKEDDALADHHSLSRQLEKSKQRLDERIASIAKCKLEVKEMEKEMKQLQETNIVSTELFEKNLKDLEGQLAKEKKSRAALEVERVELCRSLETLKEQNEQYVRELSSNIALMKKRYSDLQEEREKLQEHEAMSSLIDRLTDMVSCAEEECKQMEIGYSAEIQQLTMEAESTTRAQLDQEEVLQVQESVLKEAEAQFDSEHSRHETLKQQTVEMKTRKNHFELSIQKVKEQTAALLQPKEDLKRELRALRAEHMERLINQAAEIGATEKSIYENGLMLEQVSMENSRLHLRIEQMKEELCNVEREKEKHSEQTGRMKEEMQSLFSGLLEGWASDKLATEESAEKDRKLLEALHSLMIKIQQRKDHIGDVHSRLEKELNAMSSMLNTTSSRHKDPYSG